MEIFFKWIVFGRWNIVFVVKRFKFLFKLVFVCRYIYNFFSFYINFFLYIYVYEYMYIVYNIFLLIL